MASALRRWPAHMAFPVLDAARLLALHPDGARRLVRRGADNGLLGAVLEHASLAKLEDREARWRDAAERNAMLALRCCANAFAHESEALVASESRVAALLAPVAPALGAERRTLSGAAAALVRNATVATARRLRAAAARDRARAHARGGNSKFGAGSETAPVVLPLLRRCFDAAVPMLVPGILTGAERARARTDALQSVATAAFEDDAHEAIAGVHRLQVRTIVQIAAQVARGGATTVSAAGGDGAEGRNSAARAAALVEEAAVADETATALARPARRAPKVAAGPVPEGWRTR
jgi:hypothetical protein